MMFKGPFCCDGGFCVETSERSLQRHGAISRNDYDATENEIETSARSAATKDKFKL